MQSIKRHKFPKNREKNRNQIKVQPALFPWWILREIFTTHILDITILQRYFTQYAHLSSLEGGKVNDTHSLNFVADTLGSNPNIWGHYDAMKVVDAEIFIKSKAEEMGNMLKNEIYTIVKRQNVLPEKSILRPFWGHRRKTKPRRYMCHHSFKLCSNESTQKHALDFNETYSPVIMWSTLRIPFVLSKIKSWNTRKLDYVQLFPQASLDEIVEVFINLSRVVHIYGHLKISYYVLQQKKNFYSLR